MSKTAFHELDFSNVDELVTKSHLIRLVSSEISKLDLTQNVVGDILGLDQPNVSALVLEKIPRFSVEKLMTFAMKLGFAVSIHVEGLGISFDVPVHTAA
jgi:predicted XRE-type DNA-binding protein